MRYMNQSSHRISTGALVTIILLAVFTVAFAGLSVWAFINYMDQKDNVDEKVSRAVATAEKQQADKLEAEFIQREKEPNANFSGPSDFGTLSFKYPKTWNLYVENDGASGGDYLAYFSPGQVPPAGSASSRYALRATIVNTDYDAILRGFDARVKKGDLKTSAVKAANGATGTRLDGTFSNDLRGSAVIFKIRDKTTVIRTDANTFMEDFDKLIQTIKFVE